MLFCPQSLSLDAARRALEYQRVHGVRCRSSAVGQAADRRGIVFAYASFPGFCPQRSLPVHLPAFDRRRFLQTGAAAAALLTARRACATPFGLPLGLQLYSVRDQLKSDFQGTLQTVGSLGYRQVEAAGFYGRTPAQIKHAMGEAGLVCVSAHYPSTELEQHLDAILDFHAKLGTAHYVICSFPGFAPRSPAAKLPFDQQVTSFTLDDWKWNAHQFNQWGAKVKKAGFQFGYHNHTMEFQPQHGVVPYELLLKQTDPGLVIMEMDCGWVTVGGGSPEHYLRSYPDRIKMLHVKDFSRDAGHSSVADPPPATELGRGTADYPAIFRAVKPGSIQHFFVEQEAFPDMPWKQSLQVDAQYLEKLKA
jgi:sugar phosphate isomerase/epimerase